MHRVITENDVADTSFDAEETRAILREMVRARTFDERAVALQRRGWMSGYPPFNGQEASQVGGAYALRDTDWLVPTYRSNAMQLARGIPLSDILRFRRGHPEYHSDPDCPVFPQAVPIATQTLHAVGIGMAIDYDDSSETPRVLCYLGDGATSEGDFHEALNFAGVFDAPVVFFCENNHWAISLPRDRQTAAPTIAAKADAYGIEGMRVDGNDPLAVAETAANALDHADNGEPVLVESLTYRQGPHTTSDDPDRYRDDVALPDWRTADPIERFEEYLREQDIITDGFVDDIEQQTREQISSAVETIEETETESPEDVFDPVYADLPPRLRQQAHFFSARVSEAHPPAKNLD
ncbi:thiamine pyrophosphate-dependent enzyme [Halocatena pleomorpha]|uniref:Pyruvate dehydrogenase (Acetyl-transferring) E1 component subunit alpha n=1 Tax=Halocatena pleomorpha TaxID=1785090 RepID=A0A3P3R2S0_9EURY|nr:thiamine pyrophosphate-dependent enzyme [Halocatena pleomorpha]RRJ27624.1 pyruvate dehydrogenase (acetyl-transferring) E1 component subunit alpha [Halocatena pleomorpha]